MYARMNAQISSMPAKFDQEEAVLDMSTTTTRSGTPDDSPANRKIPRSRTVPSVRIAFGSQDDSDAESDCDHARSLPRSKTMPGLDALKLGAAYPVDLVVRNTFLEFVEESLDYVRPRLVRSAPSSPQSHSQVLGADAFSITESVPAPASIDGPCRNQQLEGPALLELASLIVEPVFDEIAVQRAPILGSLEMPTVGSMGHATGDCKPCAFFWKVGCTNGTECVYCHLCDSGAKKRRQKEKKLLMKAGSQSVVGGA